MLEVLIVVCYGELLFLGKFNVRWCKYEIKIIIILENECVCNGDIVKLGSD